MRKSWRIRTVQQGLLWLSEERLGAFLGALPGLLTPCCWGGHTWSPSENPPAGSFLSAPPGAPSSAQRVSHEQAPNAPAQFLCAALTSLADSRTAHKRSFLATKSKNLLLSSFLCTLWAPLWWRHVLVRLWLSLCLSAAQMFITED